MDEMIKVTAGEGRFQINARALRCGADWCVNVCGGETPHVGAVALGQYEPTRDSATVSTVTVHTHRDDVVASHYAKAVAATCRCTVTVTAGIHVDNAGADELAELNNVCEACLTKLLLAMEEET